jgi:16S rRNA (cytidine1402-2'-O)-methyltransferase
MLEFIYMAKLYIVATPIGNLEDITLRALRILKEVDLILAEDTRITKRLLDKYDIETPILSYHSHSGLLKAKKILEFLEEGKDLALVSDAGTPTISDPGAVLISEARKKLGDKVEIFSVPGPSALTAALSVSGLPSSDFIFLGFLPHKKGRETLFKEIAGFKRTAVFYESPHRILKTLASLDKLLGDNKRIVISRELTKIYEETISGTAKELIKYFADNPKKVKGEFVVMVEGR